MRNQEEVAEVAEVISAVAEVERRMQWAAAVVDTSAAVALRTSAVVVACVLVARLIWAALRTSAAAACVLAVHLIWAAVRAWVAAECGLAVRLIWAAVRASAAVAHMSEADRVSPARVTPAAEPRGRASAAVARVSEVDQRECDLLRGRVSARSGSKVSPRSQRAAQTGTPRSLETRARGRAR
jgi:hypothetical protein